MPPNASHALVVATLKPRLTVIAAAVERAGWICEAHADPGTALAALREGSHGLLVVDAYLRGASPAGFAAWSRRLDPARPVVVVRAGDTGHPVEGARSTTAAADVVLDFPPSAQELPAAAGSTPAAPPSAAAKALPLEGSTAVVPLPDLIEMLALGGESSSVELHGGVRGRVWIAAGALVHAEATVDDVPHTGVRALATLLAAPSSAFEVQTPAVAPRRTVHVSTPAALTEAARLVDEGRRAAEVLRRIAADVPDVLGAAIGYPLNEAPATTHGDGARAFGVAKELLELVRGQVGTASHLAVEGDRHAFAILRFGEGNVVAAHAPRGRSLVLLAALTKAVRSGPR
ncbi:MAG: DUF4388 domain-containing protein [Trueperaceae bacterium]